MINNSNYPFLNIIVCFFIISFSYAQNDVILKINGEEMQGKVTKINKEDLQFVYQNETVEYTVSIADIEKITFSSGRVEFFNKKDNGSNSKLEEHHNKVAILPFGYIKDQETSNAIMTKNIQHETFTIFNKKSANLKFQDPTTTNALLAKAGVTNNNIEGYTMGEICNILSVEYVVQGMVSVEKSTVTHFNTTTSKSKDNKAYVDSQGRIIGDIWNDDKNTSSSSYDTLTQNYSTNITMNIYTDKGDSIFSKDHASFWQTEDAYKITLTYLAKRTPVYNR